jgi:DNA-binding LytR/AlgR family response regulator
MNCYRCGNELTEENRSEEPFLIDDKLHITLAAIKDIEQNLPEKDFIRIHKSYIVPLKNILSYNKTEVKLTRNLKLPVGRFYKNAFIEALK